MEEEVSTFEPRHCRHHYPATNCPHGDDTKSHLQRKSWHHLADTIKP
jgi:hypothetical protein